MTKALRTAAAGLAVLSLALTACGQTANNASNASADATETIVEDVPTEYCELTGQDEAVGECARFERQYADLDAGRDAFSPQEVMREGETKTVTYAVSRLPREVQGEGGELAEPVDAPDPEPTAEPTSPPTAMTSPIPGIAYKNGDATPDASEGELADAGEAMSTSPAVRSEDPPPTPAASGPTQQEIDAAIAERDADNIAALGGTPEGVVTGQIKLARFMYACLGGDPSLAIEPADCQSRDTREDTQVVWSWQVTASQPGTHRLSLRSGVEVRTRDDAPRRIGQRAVNRTITVSVTQRGRWQRTMNEAEAWLRSPLGAIAALTALVLALGGLYGAIKKARRGEGGEGGDAD